MLTVGVDLGDKWSQICVLGESGEVIEEANTHDASTHDDDARMFSHSCLHLDDRNLQINQFYLIRWPSFLWRRAAFIGSRCEFA